VLDRLKAGKTTRIFLFTWCVRLRLCAISICIKRYGSKGSQSVVAGWLDRLSGSARLSVYVEIQQE
jgi:hypothetical protein